MIALIHNFIIMLNSEFRISELRGPGPRPGDGKNRGGLQLPYAFYRIKKYCSYPKLSHFEILKIHVFTVCAWT